jgi:hypothetical protein
MLPPIVCCDVVGGLLDVTDVLQIVIERPAYLRIIQAEQNMDSRRLNVVATTPPRFNSIFN